MALMLLCPHRTSPYQAWKLQRLVLASGTMQKRLILRNGTISPGLLAKGNIRLQDLWTCTNRSRVLQTNEIGRLYLRLRKHSILIGLPHTFVLVSMRPSEAKQTATSTSWMLKCPATKLPLLEVPNLDLRTLAITAARVTKTEHTLCDMNSIIAASIRTHRNETHYAACHSPRKTWIDHVLIQYCEYTSMSKIRGAATQAFFFQIFPSQIVIWACVATFVFMLPMPPDRHPS